jgi:hypothetical protein
MKFFFLAPNQFIKQASAGLVKVASRKWEKMLPHLKPINALKMLEGITKSRAAVDTTVGGVIPQVPTFGMDKTLRAIHAARVYPQLRTPEVIKAISNNVKNYGGIQGPRNGVHADYGNRTKLIKKLLYLADSPQDVKNQLKFIKQHKYGGASVVGQSLQKRRAVDALDENNLQSFGSLYKMKRVLEGKGYGSIASDGGNGSLWTSPTNNQIRGLFDDAVTARYAGGAYGYGDIPAVALVRPKLNAKIAESGHGADAQYLLHPTDSDKILTRKVIPANPLFLWRHRPGDELSDALHNAGASKLPNTFLTEKGLRSAERWFNNNKQNY